MISTLSSHYTFSIRNEQYQEELWSISCELLKEWMSPEIRDKYGPTKQENSTSNDSNGGQCDEVQQQQGDNL